MISLFFKRLYRKLRHIPTFIKEILCYKGESCRDCGQIYSYYYIISDELWKNIFGEVDYDGCYCISCLIKIANKNGISLNIDDFDIHIINNILKD